MMTIGANSVLFGGEDIRRAFEHVKRAGFDAIEVSALQGVGAFGDPLGEHLHLDRWRQDSQIIMELRDEFELPISAIEVGPLDKGRVLLAFEAATDLKIPIVNIGPSGQAGLEGDLDVCIERVADLAEVAEKARLTLCMKAHIGSSMHDTSTTLLAMNAISSPAFGIDMDPSHIHRVGETPQEALRRVISRVRHVHIRDCFGSGPGPGDPMHQTCGRGDIDLQGYCSVLVASGYEGPVNVEIIGASRYPLECCAMIAAENRGYLNACFTLCRSE